MRYEQVDPDLRDGEATYVLLRAHRSGDMVEPDVVMAMPVEVSSSQRLIATIAKSAELTDTQRKAVQVVVEYAVKVSQHKATFYGGLWRQEVDRADRLVAENRKLQDELRQRNLEMEKIREQVSAIREQLKEPREKEAWG